MVKGPQTCGSVTDTTSSESDIDQAPIDRKITELKHLCRDPAVWHLSGPGRAAPHLDLFELSKDLDLTAMEPITAIFVAVSNKSQILPPERISIWFTSVDALTTIKQWKEECYDISNMEQELNYVLHSAEDPHHTLNAELLASCALHLHDIQAGRVRFVHEQRYVTIACAVFVRRLACGLMAYIMYFLDDCVFPDVELFCYEWSARTLITACTDLENRPHGFFNALLQSDLAKAMTPEVRITWEETLGVAGKIKDVEQCTPSIQIQRAAVAFVHSVQRNLSQAAETDYKSLKITETAFAMSNRFTKLQKLLNDEANAFPGLLTAHSEEAPLSPLPVALPKKIASHKALCEDHRRTKPQLGRKRKQKHTNTTADTTAATNTTTATNTAVPEPEGLASVKAQDKLARKRRYKGKSAVESKGDTSTEAQDTAGSEKLGSGDTASKPEMSSSTSTSSPKPNVSELQEVATTPPGNVDVPVSSGDNEQPQAVRSLVEGKGFYTSKGRILPARKTIAASRDVEPFTKKDELVLYKRYKGVVSGGQVGQDTEGRLSAEKWWAQWQAIAYVLPGRGVMDCIAFYNKNTEHLQF